MTLLIKNVLLAEKEQPERVDIIVRGQRIAALGNFGTRKADRVLDGQGAFVSSGFIDIHTAADHTLDLFKNPVQSSALAQGVTTAIGGQNGLSLAPIPHGELDALKEWTHRKGMNIGWRSMREFLQIFRRLKLGVNFGSLAGYTTLREAVVGAKTRTITKNESAVLEQLFRNAMKEGALGISYGFNTIHGRDLPIAEIRSVARRIRKDTIQSFELDPREDRPERLREIIELAQQANGRFIVTGFDPIPDRPEEYKKLLAIIDSVPEELDFHFAVSPRERQTVPLYQFLPAWAKKGSLKEMNAALKDDWYRQKISAELTVSDPDDFTITNAANPVLDGMTLRTFSSHYGLRPFKKALLKLMDLTSLQAAIIRKTDKGDLVREALRHPRCLVASRETQFGTTQDSEHERPFSELLADLKDSDLSANIRKITSLPARLFGLSGRGTVAEGNFADLTIFRNGEIKHVVVNGTVAVENGSSTGSRTGTPLP